MEPAHKEILRIKRIIDIIFQCWGFGVSGDGDRLILSERDRQTYRKVTIAMLFKIQCDAFCQLTCFLFLLFSLVKVILETTLFVI